jgi:hypothetical protein
VKDYFHLITALHISPPPESDATENTKKIPTLRIVQIRENRAVILGRSQAIGQNRRIPNLLQYRKILDEPTTYHFCSCLGRRRPPLQIRAPRPILGLTMLASYETNLPHLTVRCSAMHLGHATWPGGSDPSGPANQRSDQEGHSCDVLHKCNFFELESGDLLQVHSGFRPRGNSASPRPRHDERSA